MEVTVCLLERREGEGSSHGGTSDDEENVEVHFGCWTRDSCWRKVNENLDGGLSGVV